jgi:bla regulator protein BlaR1
LIIARIKGSEIMGMIQNVFDWIMLSSAIASLMIIIIFLIKLIFRNKLSATWHYYIWFLLLIKLIVPYAPESPLSIFNLANPSIGNISVSAPNSSIETGQTLVIEKENKEENKEMSKAQLSQKNQKNYKGIQFVHTRFESFYKNISLKRKLIALWLIGVFIFTFYIFMINLKFILKLRKHSQLHCKAINQILNECKSTIHVDANIPIVISTMISTPSLCGFIRPKLLLPNDILKKVSNKELRFIFLHELAHLKRKDIVVNWIVVLLKILHWFNPVLWYGFYRMRLDCEVSCDALVLSKLKSEEHNQYGYTIIHLLKMISKPQWIPGTTGIVTGKSQIKRRITMISLFKKNSIRWSAIGIILLIALGFSMLTNAKKASIQVENTNQLNTKVEQAFKNRDESKDTSLNISLLDIKGKGFNGKMLIVPDPKKIVVGFNSDNIKIFKTTSDMAKENKAVSAINAGGFSSDRSNKKDYKPSGIIMHGGKIVYDDLKDEKVKHDIVAFTKNGKLMVGKYTVAQLKENDIQEAVSFGPSLIVNGKPTITKGDGGWGIGPRTAIGQKADGTVILLVIDGRSKKSLGATLWDVQNIFLQNGVITASNLDGGSSSTIYFKGNLVNKPSDSLGERTVASTFMVMR